MNPAGEHVRPAERLFVAVCWLAILSPLLLLAAMLAMVLVDAVPRLEWAFLTGLPSRRPELAGIGPALVGSTLLVVLTAALALPIGVGAAVYLEEYAGRTALAHLLEANIANLAGVPSILYGLLGLGVFVRTMGMDHSLLAGACTLALLVLPIVITAGREALRTVPRELREASLALGATRWQTVRQVVLPQALPGIMTASILSVSRALGETAPIVVVGALTYMTFAPTGLLGPFTALPIQIFSWVSRPQPGFVTDAAAGIVVLLLLMLTVNAAAIVIRDRLQKRWT